MTFTRKFSANAAWAAVLVWTLPVRAAEMIPVWPKDISVDGHRIDSAFALTTKLITFYFILVLLGLGWCIYKYRAREGRKADYTHGDKKKHILLSVALAMLVFTTVDLNLVGKARADLHDAFWAYPDSPGTVRVEVLAQQWAWNYRYAGADNQFNTEDDVVTVNDLRIPVNRPVSFQLRAKDVIHSFYLPNFRLKQDAIPGRTTLMWVQATEPGRFEVACAEHCGFAHYEMRSQLTVLDADAYDAWMRDVAGDSKALYRAGDTEAHWGWAWEARK